MGDDLELVKIAEAVEREALIEQERASSALSLGDDSAGGYAVPFQLDGTKRPKKLKKR